MHIAWAPLSGQGIPRSRKSPVVRLRITAQELAPKVTIEEVKLLLGCNLHARVITQQPVPPGRPRALSADAHEVRWPDEPVHRPERWPLVGTGAPSPAKALRYASPRTPDAVIQHS